MARPTLLLLPGLMCDRAAWAPQVEAFAPRFECIVPHYGTLDSLPAMAAQVLREAPPGPLPVAGHSMGGRIAFEMWAQAPQRIERLALLDTSYHPLAPRGGRRARTQRALRAAATSQGATACARWRANGRRAWCTRAGSARRCSRPCSTCSSAASLEAFAAQIEALLARRDATALLATIDVPTLLLCGREDAWSPPSRHEFMHRHIAGSRLAVIEHCGHMSTMEQPAAVNAALADWLGGPLEDRAAPDGV